MRCCSRSILFAALTAVLVVATVSDTSARMRPSFFDVVLEGGAVQPLGDLDAGFDTPAGFEASTGFDIGVRFRQRFVSGWAIAPSFHYVEFGSYLGENESIGVFETSASMYRYGVDLQYYFPAPRNAPQLFVSGGAALIRNRMREDYLVDDSFFADGVNSMALAVGGGLQVGNFEFLAQYHRNHFDTARFYDGVESYAWDYISFQVGIALPSTFSRTR